eukprot:13683224-Alexandrium_andersonii.AAC.1
MQTPQSPFKGGSAVGRQIRPPPETRSRPLQPQGSQPGLPGALFGRLEKRTRRRMERRLSKLHDRPTESMHDRLHRLPLGQDMIRSHGTRGLHNLMP